MARQLLHTRVHNAAGEYEDANGVRFSVVSNEDPRLNNSNIKLYPHTEGYEPLAYNFENLSKDAYASKYGLSLASGKDSSPVVTSVYTLALGGVGDVEVEIPVAGRVSRIVGRIDGATNTGDETITLTAVGQAAISDTVVIPNPSADDDIFSVDLSDNNVVAAGEYVTVATDGANGLTPNFIFSLIIASDEQF